MTESTTDVTEATSQYDVVSDASISCSSTLNNLDPGFLTYYLGTFLLVALVNLVGNFLVLRTISRHRTLWLPSNVFICSLAASDILFGVVYPVYNVAGIDTTAIRAVFGPWPVCRMLFMEIVALELCSAYALVSITLTRYISVVYPLQCYKFVTTRKLVTAAVIIWVTSHLVAGLCYAMQVPEAVWTGRYCEVCRFENVFTKTELGVVTVLQFGVPCFLMVVVYLRMVCIARKLKLRAVSQTTVVNDALSAQINRRHQQRSHKSSVVVTLLIGCFCMSYVPVLIFLFLSMFHVHVPGTCKDLMNATGRIFLFLNTAVNVFIYAGRLDDFRFYLRKDFQCLFPLSRRRVTSVSTSRRTSHNVDAVVVSTVMCASMRSFDSASSYRDTSL